MPAAALPTHARPRVSRLADTPWTLNSQVPGAWLRGPPGRGFPSRPPHPSTARWSAAASPCAAMTVCCGWLGRSPTSTEATTPNADHIGRALYLRKAMTTMSMFGLQEAEVADAGPRGRGRVNSIGRAFAIASRAQPGPASPNPVIAQRGSSPRRSARRMRSTPCVAAAGRPRSGWRRCVPDRSRRYCRKRVPAGDRALATAPRVGDRAAGPAPGDQIRRPVTGSSR